MILQLEHVTKTYDGKASLVYAVKDVSLDVGAGDFVVLQGPSGCGKTTALLMAGGLLKPDSGQVAVTGQNPYALTSNARAAFRARTIGFVFQQFHLVPYLSVLENVLAPCIATNPQDGSGERADSLIARFGLAHRKLHLPGELSSGERQRTALARALLNQPQLLLADEPTGNLDQENAEAVLGHMKEFAESGGAVLLVTHDERAIPFAHRVIHLRDGEISAQLDRSSIEAS